MTTAEYDKFVVAHWFGPKGESEDNFLRQLFIMSVGLGGEAGEVQEKLKKHVRDGKLDIPLLEKELGDVLFYLTMIAHTFGRSLESVMAANVEKLSSRMARGKMRGDGDER
jgi:NTP pyrophosphatase (non-canonical NTP hydrolase)